MCVLITGGSRGIGAAIAREFARQGQDVAISYLGSADKAQAVVAECEALGVQAVAIQADVSLEADCKRLLADAKAALGPVTVLVNNAGQTKDGLAMRMSLEQWEQIITTNLTGPFLMCRAILPDLLKARGGRKVWGKVPFSVAYVWCYLMELIARLLRAKEMPFLNRYFILQLNQECYLDASKARRDLGWVPQISLEDGTRQYVEWRRVQEEAQKKPS